MTLLVSFLCLSECLLTFSPAIPTLQILREILLPVSEIRGSLFSSRGRRACPGIIQFRDATKEKFKSLATRCRCGSITSCSNVKICHTQNSGRTRQKSKLLQLYFYCVVQIKAQIFNSIGFFFRGQGEATATLEVQVL